MKEDIVRKLQSQKNRNNPVAAIVIIVVFFTFWSFVTLIMWIPKLIILWIILCIVIVWAVVWNEKKQERLIELVKSWKIITVETSIIDFEVFTGYDNSSSVSWYYIICSNWINVYKSNLLERAPISLDNINDFKNNENKKNRILKTADWVFQIWDKISVYVDPNNPKNYFVDC